MSTTRRKSRMFADKNTLRSAKTNFDGEQQEGKDKDDDEEDEDDNEEEQSESLPTKKEPVTMRKVTTRTITGFLMITLYLLILRAGHFYCILLGVVTQFELFRELVNVRYVAAKEKKMPWFRSLQWGWFITAMLWIYGEDLHKFCNERQQLTWLTQITEYLDNAVFFLYCFLFIATVLTLKQGLLRFQLSQFMWTVVIICITVLQVKYFAKTTLSGLFWFFFPMATVVMNDVSAYFCGISLGKRFIKTPLIAISPNKTWEGFVGAFFCTLIFSFYFPALLSRFKWISCPAEGIYFSIPPPLTCSPSAIFLPTKMLLPFVGETEIRPIQLHGLAYGMFASLVAPFGGFFASAIKRAYNKKDFESFMPGHGGMMDRMDCQLLMMAFNSYYFRTFINSRVPSVQKMLFLASLMPVKEQVELVYELTRKLDGLRAHGGV